jgi:hypothetical protein
MHLHFSYDVVIVRLTDSPLYLKPPEKTRITIMNIELTTQEISQELDFDAQSLRDLGDVELCLVGGGDVVVVGL